MMVENQFWMEFFKKVALAQVKYIYFYYMLMLI